MSASIPTLAKPEPGVRPHSETFRGLTLGPGAKRRCEAPERERLLHAMVRSCRVTLQDMEGVTHAVEVTAESLFEAVARGLAALRGREWVAGITQGTVKVSVADVRVEHETIIHRRLM
jgi:hypothetical protein